MANNLCYTHVRMQTESLAARHSSWSHWANFLRQRKLESLAAWVLEAFAPLTVVGAQFLYFSAPLICPAFSSDQIKSLADLLDDPVEARAFAAYLREEVIL